MGLIRPFAPAEDRHEPSRIHFESAATGRSKAGLNESCRAVRAAVRPAARLVEGLKGDARDKYAKVVADGVLKYQESDGSWWDFPMWDFHKPYGTAFAVMTLLRCNLTPAK